MGRWHKRVVLKVWDWRFSARAISKWKRLCWFYCLEIVLITCEFSVLKRLRENSWRSGNLKASAQNKSEASRRIDQKYAPTKTHQ